MNDLLTDDNGEMKIVNGDFVVDDANHQHIRSIIAAKKGDWKQHPLIGVGIMEYINAPLTRAVKTKFEKEVRLQLNMDGFEDIIIEVENWESINITANK